MKLTLRRVDGLAVLLLCSTMIACLLVAPNLVTRVVAAVATAPQESDE